MPSPRPMMMRSGSLRSELGSGAGSFRSAAGGGSLTASIGTRQKGVGAKKMIPNLQRLVSGVEWNNESAQELVIKTLATQQGPDPPALREHSPPMSSRSSRSDLTAGTPLAAGTPIQSTRATTPDRRPILGRPLSNMRLGANPLQRQTGVASSMLLTKAVSQARTPRQSPQGLLTDKLSAGAVYAAERKRVDRVAEPVPHFRSASSNTIQQVQASPALQRLASPVFQGQPPPIVTPSVAPSGASVAVSPPAVAKKAEATPVDPARLAMCTPRRAISSQMQLLTPRGLQVPRCDLPTRTLNSSTPRRATVLSIQSDAVQSPPREASVLRQETPIRAVPWKESSGETTWKDQLRYSPRFQRRF